MPGRPDFSQAGTAGGGQTVAMVERPEVVYLNEGTSADVASGTIDTLDVYADAGSVLQLVNVYLSAHGTGTSGYQAYQVGQTDDTSNIWVVRGESNYADKIIWNRSHWSEATKSKKPTNEAAAVQAVQSLMATENNPIRVQYWNETDATQSSTRNRRFLFKEVTY